MRKNSPVDVTRAITAPIAFGIIMIGLWQLFVTSLNIAPFIMPSPAAIFGQFTAHLDSVTTAALATGCNAIIGLCVGLVAGAILALLASAWRVIEWMSAPIVTILSVIPIVALAPILYTMFGSGENTGRQIVAALSAFVPIFYNTLAGLHQVRPVHYDLMRVYAVSRFEFARRVSIPGALPNLFTGLRIASSLAVISALVAEYLGGPSTGLGRAITTAASSSNYPLAWAFVLGSIILGLMFYIVTRLLEAAVSRRLRV